VNKIVRAGYAATGHIARVAASIFPPATGKIGRSFSLRRGVEARFAAWGAEHRDRTRPLAWMHAPSVGEGLQARPILESLRQRHPDLQLVYTYFSPSAQSFAHSLAVDFQDVLPFDTRGGARAVLDAVDPTVLIFSKLDVWPFLVEEANGRNVGLVLVSATLPARSSRLKGFAPALLRDAYSRIDAVGAISPEDGERLITLGCRPKNVEVTGDTRFDQVWMRSHAADRNNALLAPLSGPRLTLVAGSTWPSDEERLLPAILLARAAAPGLRCIIAPHEPSASAVANLEAWSSSVRLEARRLGHPFARDADLIIVDKVGVLGDLYALADIAYVGGGFHAAGLHSVLEPAAFGVPVAFGPMNENSRDANVLELEGGGASAPDARTLAAIFSRWLLDAAARMDAGHRARAMVERGTGATARSVALVERVMGRSPR
jgi:3-deoxy-D-manno-octulosonic-acid transferase